MKIGISDNNDLKFCRDIKEHWEKEGHEVRYERGTSEYLAQWADIYYIDFADNNLAYLFKLYHSDSGVSRPGNWDNNKKPLVVVRAIDWEIWTLAMHRDQAIVDWVDKWICIAPHIEKKLRAEANFRHGQLELIRPGINLEKFTLKTTKTDGYQIGMVLGDMWWPKNHMGGLEIFNMLGGDKWHLHIRGQHEGGEYWSLMYEHYIKSRGLENQVTLYPQVADMNQWYEQIDILLHPGMKESFCYAVAEALAKGIKPVIYNFYGAEDIWPRKFLFNDYNEAIRKICEPTLLEPETLRDFIAEEYRLEKMLKAIDDYLEI